VGERCGVLGEVRAGSGFEMVAEIRGFFVAFFFGRGFLAVLGVADVVLDAEFADVEFGVAGFAGI